MGIEALGHYFGLGRERHRAVEDARMNPEILKKCSMTMFLEEHTGSSTGKQDAMNKAGAEETTRHS